MAKKFKVKTRDNLRDRIIHRLALVFKKSPEFIDVSGEEMPPRCILIGNHSGASGAFTYRTFMKKRFMTWGAHQMCEGYRSRWKYLYHIFYRKKLGYGKFKAFTIATLFGLISRYVYGFAGIIPIYYDMNIRRTFSYSFDCLEKDISVFVFPENSETGYSEIIEKDFFPGFIKLAQLYFNKHGVDLPIYTLHFSGNNKKVVVGKAHYYQQMKKEMDDKSILTFFREYMNSLHDNVLEKVAEDRAQAERDMPEKAKRKAAKKAAKSEAKAAKRKKVQN